MVRLLDFEEYGAGIGSAWTVLREHANRAGPDAAVPSCPGWRVRDLVAHQGMVHRWATGFLRGERVDPVAVEEEGRTAPDQLDWLDRGVRVLLQAFVDTPEDAALRFFLAGDLPPRLAWARRQCHETTVHAIDAMSASLGRLPTAAELWIGTGLAIDGVDELLRGFVARERSALRSARGRTVAIEANDTGDAWTLLLGAGAPVAGLGAPEEPDVVVRGSAIDLYLGLWNRGAALDCADEEFVAGWRRDAAVTWD